MKTNVYKASYDDLSEVTVNAESMSSAITELQEVRKDAEPSLLRKIITGITIPDPPEPPVSVDVTVTAEMVDGETPVPDTIAVRPTELEVPAGSLFRLYAIDTASTPEVEFVGWYLGEDLIGTTTSLGYTIPEDRVSPLHFVAKYQAL